MKNNDKFQSKITKIVVLQPPSPPFKDVDREFTAGLGQADDVARPTWGHDRHPFFNHSLAWTAGILEESGFDVSYFDGQAEKWDKKDVLNTLSDLRPDFLISLVNLPTIYEDISLLTDIKKELSLLTIITVGTVCKIFPEIILNSNSVDFVSIGDPEVTIKLLIEGLIDNDIAAISDIGFKKNNEIKLLKTDNGQANIDELPPIPYHLLPMDKYRGVYFATDERIAPIITSRGCPFRCGYYCPYPNGYGSKVRFRAPNKVVDEIELLVEKYDINNFIFRDQNFTINSDHAKNICDGIISRKININWVCETRLALAGDLELLKLMRAAGCSQINFGLESGDPDLFEQVGKPGTTFKQIEEAIAISRQCGIKAHAHIIIGLPGETWRSIAKTYKLLKSCKFDSVNFSLMTAYPGTEFYQEAKENKFILTDDLSKYSHSSVVVKTEKMRGLELKIAYLLMSKIFSDQSLTERLFKKISRNIKKMGYSVRQRLVSDASS